MHPGTPIRVRASLAIAMQFLSRSGSASVLWGLFSARFPGGLAELL